MVGRQARDAGVREQPALRLAQDDRDLGGAVGQALPVRRKNGTPFQRALSIQARTATNVSTVESGATSSSSRYPGTSRPSTTPATYWPRTSSSSENGRTASSSSALRSRTSSGASEAGGSIATNASTWSRWFWTMSRSAPACS